MSDPFFTPNQLAPGETLMIRPVVSMLSSGAGSTYASKLAIDKYGAENVTLLFCDVRGDDAGEHDGEDADNYRFLAESAELLGAELVTVRDGRSVWDVFRDERIIGNTRIAPCSKRLKQIPARKWIEENCDEDTILVVGIDWSETHRLPAVEKGWLPYKVWAPLTEEPYTTKDQILDWLKENGVEPPRLYEQGFAHANCGGFCVRGGQGHFKTLLEQNRERYLYHEQREQGMRDYLGKDVSILRDRTGGTVKPLTLHVLRQRIEGDGAVDELDVGGCGCFVDTEDDVEPIIVTEPVEDPFFTPNQLAPGETLEPEVNWLGQFRIKCPDGVSRWYTRCTTFIGNLEDETLIHKWRNRMLLDGMLADPELWVKWLDLKRSWDETGVEDKMARNDLAQMAFVAGGGEDASSKGTFLHALTYRWDTGRELPTTTTADHADLDSYLRLCSVAGLRSVSREQRVVIDHLKVTGTPDMVCEGYRCLDGKVRNVIADLKTGVTDDYARYGTGKDAQQLAMYADGEEYTDDGSATGVRTPFPVEVSRDIGLILHVPQGGAIVGQQPTLYEVNLRVGRYGVGLSKELRDWRNFSKRVFTEVPLS